MCNPPLSDAPAAHYPAVSPNPSALAGRKPLCPTGLFLISFARLLSQILVVQALAWCFADPPRTRCDRRASQYASENPTAFQKTCVGCLFRYLNKRCAAAVAPPRPQARGSPRKKLKPLPTLLTVLIDDKVRSKYTDWTCRRSPISRDLAQWHARQHQRRRLHCQPHELAARKQQKWVYFGIYRCETKVQAWLNSQNWARDARNRTDAWKRRNGEAP